MGEYGTGITMKKALAFDKERIKMALKGKLIVGEDETGFIYDDFPQKECEEYIIGAFDNAAYHCIQANASGRAMEKLMKKKKCEPTLKEYMEALMEEQAMDNLSGEYKYESEEI